jgi:hypothetical protein
MVRYSFGIVDAAYTISDSSDWLNEALINAYGIGFSTAGTGPSDYLGFNDGSSVSVLSTAQGNITLNTPQTMSITVTPSSWSYSLNGAPPTTGSFVTPFDTTKKYRFIAHAQDLRNQNISSITLTAIAQPVANNQSRTTPEDTATNLVLTASDSDSTNLTYAIVSNPAHGSLGALNPTTGAVTYTPTTNYNGADSFTFTAFDGSLYSTGTVSLTVTAAVAPFPITLTLGSGSSGSVTNLALSLPTVWGYYYVLQSATNLVAPVIWKNESTNAGTGGSLLLNVPVTPGKPHWFGRMLVY